MNGRVVVVRHRAGSRVYHLLPGGGVDYRETVAEALVREVNEETGLDVAVGRPLIISDTIDPAGTRHVINVTFSAEVTGGSLAEHPADPRVEAVELREPSGLRELDLRPPLAELILDVLADPEGFRCTYAGSLFSPER
jgi:ADP-ribose pyrophosphatase YjhB (NUDIX family)